jgi:hypothetical protein
MVERHPSNVAKASPRPSDPIQHANWLLPIILSASNSRGFSINLDSIAEAKVHLELASSPNPERPHGSLAHKPTGSKSLPFTTASAGCNPDQAYRPR